MRSRGLALILVVGTLGVLAVVGSAFVVLSRLERRAAQQRVWGTQALLLARSGVEDALARLCQAQDPADRGNRYGGEDWDLSGGSLSVLESQSEAFQPGTANGADCPVRCAMRPSFSVLSGPDPRLARVDGRERGYSGRLGSERAVWALKVEDESAKIHVNAGPGWNAQLERILNVLGDQPEVACPNLGTQAMSARPAGGWRSVRELETALGITRDLSPYLTVRSWVDAKVVRPNGFLGQAPVDAVSDILKARTPLRLEVGGRPPVNLNAAERPVLVSLLQGLQAYSWQTAYYPIYLELSDPAMAAAVADRILSSRPFRTWNDFERFCDSLAASTVNGVDVLDFTGNGLYGADLLKANFNPNTDLVKFVPDQLMWKWVDKSDLITGSTEGCLSPTGIFRIASVGRVLGRDGSLRSEREADLTVEAFSLLRHTTQKDFVAGRARLQKYLSLCTDPLQRTTGASAPDAWWGELAPEKGLAAITYPSPPTALPGNAADFDGCVGLATTEIPPEDPGNGSFTFLHHFDDSLTADSSLDGALQPLFCGADPAPFLQTDLSRSAWPSPAAEPNTLRPDGFHAQAGRSPAFKARENFPRSFPPGTASNHATVAYWIKKDLWLGNTDFVCAKATGFTQTFSVGDDGSHWGLILEDKAASSDAGHERQWWIDRWEGGGEPRWYLAMAIIDTDAMIEAGNPPPVCEAALYLWSLVGGNLGVGGIQDGTGGGSYNDDFEVATAEDLFPAGSTFVIGAVRGGPFPAQLPRTANQVVDEFAVADFGDVNYTLFLRSGEEWGTDDLYPRGRYYKGNDAAYTSASVTPGTARVLRAEWTACLPGEDRRVCPGGTNPPDGVPRQIDDTLRGSRVRLDLLDAAGSPVQTLRQGRSVQRTLAGFRYRAVFQPTPDWTADDLLNDPVLETPFLDDVTFAVGLPGGPRILSSP